MLLKVKKSTAVKGAKITVPGSKSHTIRALFISSLASGKSIILKPLISDDALSAVNTCKSFGAQIEVKDDFLRQRDLEVTLNCHVT